MFDSFFQSSSASTGIPVEILQAIAWTESSMNPNADAGGSDGVGLMGVTLTTARALGFQGTRDQLKDPATNIEYGALAAADIVARQGGIQLAELYSEYNSGRKDLWRTSQQVSTHVLNFLQNFADVIGVEIPAGGSITDALSALGSIVSSGNGPTMLIMLAVVYYFWKGGHK